MKSGIFRRLIVKSEISWDILARRQGEILMKFKGSTSRYPLAQHDTEIKIRGAFQVRESRALPKKGREEKSSKIS